MEPAVDQACLQVWRDLYSFACLSAAMTHLRQIQAVDTTLLNDKSAFDCAAGDSAAGSEASAHPSHLPQAALASAMHELDMAAIMGGNLFRPEVDRLIAVVQGLYQQCMHSAADTVTAKRKKRCKHDDVPQISKHSAQGSSAHESSSLPSKQINMSEFSNLKADGTPELRIQQSTVKSACQLPPRSFQVNCSRVTSEELPSLER